MLELLTVRRNLGGALSSTERQLFNRSVRSKVLKASLGGLAIAAVFIVMFLDLRSSYTLGYDSSADRARARVVVRMGRPGRPFVSLLPHKPAFGSVLADTGFSASGLSPDLATLIDDEDASGKLERSKSPAVPGWLRQVLSGLRPAQRGTATVLLGEPTGVRALQQAFSDPLSRRETLDVLEVVGGGGAGEDEILAAALSDPAPELRKRGVEVAAAIDRREKKGAHASTLRNALSDEAASVREAVLKACSTLPADEASQILGVALGSNDLALRRQAQRSIRALAARSPRMAAQAAWTGAKSKDAVQRREGMTLLMNIAEQSPAQLTDTLSRIVTSAETAEDIRVQALRLLRKAGVSPEELAPVIEQAVSPEASPRLRAAALPLHAQIIDPAAAEELAQAEWRGSALSRAAAAAIWGALSKARPEGAAKALKVALFDSATEVRAEAARSLGNLRRDGLKLVQRALLDPKPEVQKAAIESAVALAGFNAYQVTEALGKALRLVRPAMQPLIVSALGQVGKGRAKVVLPPLVKAFKQGNPRTRREVAKTLCALAEDDPKTTSPYLRLAARDADHDTRSHAASCLGALAEGDPRGAARMATELAQADEPSVRTAAARALKGLVAKAGKATLPALIGLLGDRSRDTRMAAVEAVLGYVEAGHKFGASASEIEKALDVWLIKGDREERRQAVAAAAAGGLVNILRQAANEADEIVRLEAIRGAARTTPPEIDLLRAAADSESPAVRTEAVRLLVQVSGGAVSEVLPIFEAMLRSAEPETRQRAASALGSLVGVEQGATDLLNQLLRQRSERVRRAAAEALGEIAQREPAMVLPVLERVLTDSAHDVRVAAGRGLAVAWAAQKVPATLAQILVQSEADSSKRFVALEALILRAADESAQAPVRTALEGVTKNGPPLARLAARVGLAFVGAPVEDLRTFLDRLLGG